MIVSTNSTHTLPPCSVAFKEWAGVCDALKMGRQSLILRKGGVSEGPDGFRPEHPAFWLYPTHVHQAEQGLRNPGVTTAETEGVVLLDTLAVVEWLGRVDRLEQLEGLASFHDWTEATVLTRFHYRKPGLWALAVRVYHKADPWPVPITEAHLGCKTWVPLEDPPPTADLIPALTDSEAAERLERLRSLTGTETGSSENFRFPMKFLKWEI